MSNIDHSANLEDVITDSVNDAVNDSDLDAGTSVAEDSTPAEADTTSDTTAEDVAADTSEESSEVPSPAKGQVAEVDPAEPQDEFSKLAGVPQMGFGGRENRIPYSRVKKITEKAVTEIAEVALGRKLNTGEKAMDVVKAHVAQIPELTTKVSDYETRLQTVGQFEQVMVSEPERFLSMLARVPAYKEFFEFVGKAAEVLEQGGGQLPAQAAAATAAPVVDVSAGMPEPDEELSDGSKVYSMDGLKKLLAWNASQVETRVTSNYEKKLQEVEQRYGPVAADWKERRRIEATLPVVRKQIEEAKSWPLFTESENEITEALRQDPQISLEGAYRKVVFPKLISERNKMRQDVIREVQAAPTSTSMPTRAVTKPSAPAVGPRSLEDVIKEQVERLK